MKTDSIFYRIFQELPSIFFELIGNSPHLAETYTFSSIEIKQTAFRIDGVFLPTQGEQNPIYFVEVQFQTDTEIYSRLFSEIYLYLRQNQRKNSWRGVVIYPTRSLDTSDINNYSEFFTSQRVTRIYLDELGETISLPIGIATIKLIVENKDTAIVTARELIDRSQQEINAEPKRQQLLQLIETILVYKFPTMSRKEIEEMFGLSDLKQTRVYQEAKQEGLQEGKQEGLQEGKQEGLQEGSLKAKLAAVSRLLALGLTVEQIAQALDLNVEQVRQATQGD
ncbi:Rpn family recombination-promoting nuclease/putative transposase [Nodularia spumigena]|uniref:Rpn family recombination-promoting nuclease/putative transposase n=1 Tax=Nodularia spumigena TaxID=70799 RepID=UPI00232E3595|nr:Rpn family recombination-promoting nuclease/putative transposase [Nodularia spumigena]MDB9306084.1 Rpn family recombination-promoting nuclease/putative transposase [Nodularia spumigena CS-591/12]MDB9319643.1 Rpn family recombination-promoting nuclease/putative transposase [Nodularia spumigena CS-590/01A]MDB9326978.1 Rpn family recombination-promoting nuclease/putative transposase [Nodularia spumigena CS-590/02]MDB9334924.1 Rpn family recombination-promoting nuclease/putative transposase [Nod